MTRRRQGDDELIEFTVGQWRWVRTAIVLAVLMGYAALVLAAVTAGLAWSALADPMAF